MEAFGVQCRDANDRCISAGLTVDPEVQVMQFIHLLDPHFDHWTASKREQMPRDQTTLLHWI